VADFDAELYLRLTGERALLDPDAGDGGPLNSRGGAAAPP
jgi:hypothetical protein